MNLFTLMFTLQGRNPEENPYIKMTALLIDSLRTTGTWNIFSDRLFVMADQETWDAFVRYWGKLIQFTHIPIPRPRTVLEGIANRYKILHFVDEPLIPLLYCDSDMISIRPFRLSEHFPPDSIAVYPEGGSADPNYCGEGGWTVLDHPGLSAGFWAVCSGSSIKALFDEIYASICRGPHNFYTVEQPHFNASIKKGTRAFFLDRNLVSFNGHNMTLTTAFINCAGEPGNGDFHWNKMEAIAKQIGIIRVYPGELHS